MVELFLNGFQIVKNIRVIELKVVEDQRTRAVMYEFGTLIEECAVVLVRFNNEKSLSPKRAETSKFPGTPPMTKPGL